MRSGKFASKKKGQFKLSLGIAWALLMAAFYVHNGWASSTSNGQNMTFYYSNLNVYICGYSIILHKIHVASNNFIYVMHVHSLYDEGEHSSDDTDCTFMLISNFFTTNIPFTSRIIPMNEEEVRVSLFATISPEDEYLLWID